METNLISNEPLPGKNLREKALPYFKHWYLFLISIVVCLSGVWLYLNYTTPLFKVTSTLLIPDDKKGDGILKSTAFSDLNMFQEPKTVDNEMEVLRSKDLIFSVLKKLNLQTSYFEEDVYKTNELYGDDLPFVVSVVKLAKAAYLKKLELKIFSKTAFLLTEGKKTWIYSYGQTVKHPDYAFKVDKGPSLSTATSPVTIKFRDIKKLAAAYSAGALQVNPVIKESNTLILSLIDAVPDRGIDILTNIINTYNVENVQKQNAMALNTIVFIDKRLKDLEGDLSYTEGDIEKYKQQNSAADIAGGAQVNLTKSAEYGQLLEESNAQLGVVNSIQAYLGIPGNQYNAVPSTMGLKDPVLNTLVNRFNDLQLERNRMLNSANLSNPLVMNLSTQIENLRVNINENLNNIKKGFMIGHKYLSHNSAQYSSKISSVPSLERGLLQRSREQGVKTNLYQYLLQKREETALSLSATIPSAQIIDNPAYDAVPEYPKDQLIWLLGIIAAILIPSLTIFLKEQLNIKVKNPSGLLRLKGIKILGEISHHDKLLSPVAVQKGSTTILSELFRYIRSNIDIFSQGLPHKTLLVTSCAKGEGKTFFAINMGLTLANLNRRVLIMEFDLRKPDLLQTMDITQKKGITDFLEGETDALYDCIQPVDGSENLFVMGCGKLPDNPAELLTTWRVDMLFNWCKSQFDYIIIDSSPVGAVADAFSLAKHADLCIYLIRYNYTSTEQLEILRDIHENEKLKNLMVVFNDAKKENRPSYTYGSKEYSTA